MMNNKFDRIETYLRAIFEQNLPKIFTGEGTQFTLVDELVQVMKNNLQKDLQGQLNAPDVFILNVPQDDMIDWQVHQDILNEIAESIHKIGLKEGFRFQKPAKIEIQADFDLPKGSFSIKAHFSPQSPDLPDTAVMMTEEELEHENSVPENAMLIIAGKTNFPLLKPVIDIGRHSGNDLVLNDPYISRHHAQLRAIKDHFVIFDVGSTGGLYLNGKPITQATLHAGDVIRIGVIKMIYNQEPTNAYPTSVMPVENEDHLYGDVTQ